MKRTEEDLLKRIEEDLLYLLRLFRVGILLTSEDLHTREKLLDSSIRNTDINLLTQENLDIVNIDNKRLRAEGLASIMVQLLKCVLPAMAPRAMHIVKIIGKEKYNDLIQKFDMKKLDAFFKALKDRADNHDRSLELSKDSKEWEEQLLDNQQVLISIFLSFLHVVPELNHPKFSAVYSSYKELRNDTATNKQMSIVRSKEIKDLKK